MQTQTVPEDFTSLVRKIEAPNMERMMGRRQVWEVANGRKETVVLLSSMGLWAGRPMRPNDFQFLMTTGKLVKETQFKTVKFMLRMVNEGLFGAKTEQSLRIRLSEYPQETIAKLYPDYTKIMKWGGFEMPALKEVVATKK